MSLPSLHGAFSDNRKTVVRFARSAHRRWSPVDRPVRVGQADAAQPPRTLVPGGLNRRVQQLWTRLSHYGVANNERSPGTTRAKFTNRLLVITSAILFIYLLIGIALDHHLTSFIQFICIGLMMVALFVFSGRGQHSQATFIFYAVMILDVGICSLLTPERSLQLFILPISAAGLVMLEHLWKGSLMFLFGFVVLMIDHILGPSFSPIYQMPAGTMERLGMVTLTLVFFATFLLVLTVKVVNQRFERDLLQKRSEIRQKHMELSLSHDELTSSIRYAQHVQAALLPCMNELKQLVPQSFVMDQPKNIVSGDFSWFSKASDGRLMVAVADCTGHGIAGALVSTICSNALDRAVNEFKLVQPAAVLDKVNELVKAAFNRSDTKASDGMDITLCSISCEPADTSGEEHRTRIVEFAGANSGLWVVSEHEHMDAVPPLDDEVIRTSINYPPPPLHLHMIKGTKQPIGNHPTAQPFTNQRLTLRKGDMIFLSSDGYRDQFGGGNGGKFKLNNFNHTLIEAARRPLAEQAELLRARFEKWKGGYEQVDDVCVMGIRL